MTACTVTGATYTGSISGSGYPIGSNGNFSLWALQANAIGDVTDDLTGREIGTVTFEQAEGGIYDPTYLSYSDIEVALSSAVGFTR